MEQHHADWPPTEGANRPLEIVYRQIDELNPNRGNPRQHSRRQIQQLAHSMKTFGFTVPALIDAENNVIAGNGRIAAARELGLGQIPTITIDRLSPAKRQALMIADNRLAEKSSWNRRMLAQELKDLSLAELDFEIPVIGFESKEIELKIAGIDRPQAAKDPADLMVIPGPSMPVCKAGDLWRLGNHLVLCGTAILRQHLETLFGGEERAAMVFTAPAAPFGNSLILPGSMDQHPCGTAQAEMSSASILGFLSESLKNQAGFCVGGALLYVCLEGRHMPELLAAAQEANTELCDLCVWVKDNPSRGSLYRSQYELVSVLKNGTGGDGNNVQLGGFGRARSNVWRYPEVKAPARRAKGEQTAVQPPGRPVAMASDAILDVTATGDIVLDGCLGTGTTLLAAERTGRRCFGVEFHAPFVDTAILRWQKLTGGVARHAVSGRTFEELARAAEVADAA